MISLKHKKFQPIVIAVIGFSVLGVLLSLGLWNSCEVEHASILYEINTYEKTLDPEFCENLVFRILEFNDECDYQVEILDCG